MKIDWEVIKEKILNNIQDGLGSGKPAYTEADIKEGIELFVKLVIYPTSVNSLKGLHNVIMPALQDAYILKKGEIGPLRLLADSFESYLKKLCIVVLNKPAEQVEHMSLIPL